MWEFIRCDMKNTKWANAFKIKSKSANRLARLRIATNVQFAKTVVSAKWNKGKHKKQGILVHLMCFLLKQLQVHIQLWEMVKDRHVVPLM